MRSLKEGGEGRFKDDEVMRGDIRKALQTSAGEGKT